MRHAFLNALETSGCVGAGTGWLPVHLSLTDAAGKLAGAMPLYLKSHSYGEFVFDWAWADAYRRHGLDYYPKLLTAAPFSPVTGPRLLGAPYALAEAAVGLVESTGLSSLHALFVTEAEAQALTDRGWLARTDCQFQWRNRGYRDFDDFLETFTAAKRKKVLRERRRVREAGVEFRVLDGGTLDAPLLDAVYKFYCMTYLERGRRPYLNREFFTTLAATMGRELIVILACHGGEPVAAAICLSDGHALYGRHWGCDRHFHSLHFETCYYQGIEYCLDHGLGRFEPGTQGEHKLARGFEPVLTRSMHWIPDPDFRTAIAEYLARERSLIDAYRDDARRHLPFRCNPV